MPEVKGRLITPRLSGAPSSPTAGELYYDTGTNTLYVYNGTSWVDLAATGGGGTALPAGIIEAYAGSAIPSGWLLCDGSLVSRTTYSALFTAIGTTYGAGDGSTTFALPDLRGDFLVGKAASGTFNVLGKSGGEETHVLVAAEMPSHTHTFTGSALATHTHTFTGTAMAAHSHSDSAGTPAGSINSVSAGTPAGTVASAGVGETWGTHSAFAIGTQSTTAQMPTGALNSNAHTHTFTGSALAAHGHTFTGTAMAAHTHSDSAGTPAGTNAAVSAGTPAGTNSNTGGDGAHNNLPPYQVVNYMIKT